MRAGKAVQKSMADKYRGLALGGVPAENKVRERRCSRKGPSFALVYRGDKAAGVCSVLTLGFRGRPGSRWRKPGAHPCGAGRPRGVDAT